LEVDVYKVALVRVHTCWQLRRCSRGGWCAQDIQGHVRQTVE
jgi:hypothetical protein